MKKLTIGKYYGLQKITGKNGGISILALDHRQNLKRAINPAQPELVGDTELSQFKVSVSKILTPYASAVLLDPEVGVLQAISERAIHKTTGLILAIEETGYTGEQNLRESKLLPGWSVKRAKLIGVDAIKLLVYYHPHSVNAWKIEKLVGSVADQCKRWDLIFMVEPLTYSIDPQEHKLKGKARQEIILETAQRLSKIGSDILKVEFPIDIDTYPDELLWSQACEDLTNSIDIPWILLSASVDFETYLKQVIIACKAGAAGIAAGRAVWKEAVNKSLHERDQFLSLVSSRRMEKLSSVVDENATSWTNYFYIDLDVNIE